MKARSTALKKSSINIVTPIATPALALARYRLNRERWPRRALLLGSPVEHRLENHSPADPNCTVSGNLFSRVSGQFEVCSPSAGGSSRLPQKCALLNRPHRFKFAILHTSWGAPGFAAKSLPTKVEAVIAKLS
jgi:hypothetical protein